MLSLSKVSFAWGPQEVLREVSLFVGRGEKVGLAGVNGAGKSTLLQLAAGLVEPDDGGVSRPNRTGCCRRSRRLPRRLRRRRR